MDRDTNERVSNIVYLTNLIKFGIFFLQFPILFYDFGITLFTVLKYCSMNLKHFCFLRNNTNLENCCSLGTSMNAEDCCSLLLFHGNLDNCVAWEML